jgi:hypothetical protein
LALTEIAAAHAAGRLPIVVGGTGLYLRALQYGLASIPPIPEAIRGEAAELYRVLGGAAFRERLAALPGDDWRHGDPDFTEPRVSRHLAIADELRTLGGRHGRSAGEMAIAWTLRHEAVTGAIVGVRSAAQVDGVMRAAEVEHDVWEVSLSA